MQASAPAVLVEDVEGPACADDGGVVVEECDPFLPTAVLVLAADGQFDQSGGQIVPDLTPIKSGMDHEYLDAGEDQDEETQCDNPMRHAYPKEVKGFGAVGVGHT